MLKKYIRFQEIITDEQDSNIVITIATLQNQSKTGLIIQSGPSFSSETTDLTCYKDERTEYELTPEEFDELQALYENNKKEFLLFKRGETIESANY